LDIELNRYCDIKQQEKLDALNSTYPNNDEQQSVVDIVVDALSREGSTLFVFVQGLAGTGKSNLGITFSVIINTSHVEK
jgi:hypothetical protein